MATSVNPNSDPFRGGGKFVAGAPTSGPTGSITPASTGGSLVGGVQGSTPMLARNNRGTNITIPYARVVLHPAGRTALPAAPKDQDPQQNTLGKPGGDLMVETEFLYSGRVCFILGRRGRLYQNAGVDKLLGFESDATHATPVNSRQQNMLHQFAVGGVDQHTMQRMCSFEYLQRYFHYVLRTKVIDLGGGLYGPLNPNGGTAQQNAAALEVRLKGVPSKYASAAVVLAGNDTKLNNINGKTVIDTIQVAENGKSVDPALTNAVVRSGIFAGDDGPFLRGKTLESQLEPYRRNHQRACLAIGDLIAFEALEARLKDVGALDWVPDGIVLSKLDSGAGSDRLADDLIDARDGQLYNVTIGGPAITSSWTGDPKMEVLPLDKLFVVLVGDVWTGAINLMAMDGATAIDTIDKVWTEAGKTDGKTYDALFKEHIEPNGDDRVAEGDATSGTRGTLDAPANQIITNIRMMRMTSSQMISYSAYSPGNANSRIGLKIGKKGGEYIIGGWCMGTVIDSAAARAMPDGMSLVGSVKRARSSHASNLLVNIKWCSADHLYRNYMNRPSLGSAGNPTAGLLRSRYDMRRRAIDKFNGPATKRP